MAKRFLLLLLIAGLFALDGGGRAQEAPAAKNKRTVYLVRHGDAQTLAGLLAKHFKGDADVQVLPDAPSNCLLISAAPNAFTEVVKVLEQMDRRPHLIEVEVLIGQFTPKKEEGKPSGKELNPKEFSGASKEVVEKLEALKMNGTLSSLKRIQVTAVENRPSSVLVGETKPVVGAVTRTGAGIVSRAIHYRNTGSKVTVTARVTAENQVLLDLSVDTSRLHVPDDGIEIGKDENGAPLRATEVVTAQLRTQLSVAPGQAVAAEGVKTNSKSGQGQTLIIVAARILEPAAKASK
jgi:type II secretory pathway component GspD/PulD (secretin)